MTTEWSRPTSAQSVHDDINLPGLEELVDDDLEPFTDPQLDNRGASCAASRAASRAVSLAASSVAAAAAAASTTTRKRGRPKGSKNKQRKKQSSEQYEEIKQQQVVEASASSYNTRHVGGSSMHGWMIHSQVNNLYLAKSELEKPHHHELLEMSRLHA